MKNFHQSHFISFFLYKCLCVYVGVRFVFFIYLMCDFVAAVLQVLHHLRIPHSSSVYFFFNFQFVMSVKQQFNMSLK